MKKLLPYLRYFRRITGSIAFLPALISFSFVIFAIVFLYIEEREYFPLLKNQIDFAIVKSADTARNLLGILIGGVISLMVFSFSMVMVVLSQALSSLSPRVIPGLISDKRHQTVLGFYLGTLLYLFLVMINLKPGSQIVTIQLNVLVAVVSGISCLILFTYFIHTISQGIQVDVILEDIYMKTKSQLSKIQVAPEEQPVSDQPELGYTVLYSHKNGYYNGFNEDAVIDYCERAECNLYITVRMGSYVYEEMPVGYISKKMEEDERDELLQHLFLENEISNDHYLYGLKYITEIGVKSLSPGINDPGTAIKAINFLAVLLAIRMQVIEKNYRSDKNNMLRVQFKPLDIETLLYHFITPIRIYAAKDVTVLQVMVEAQKNLIRRDMPERRCEETFRSMLMSIRSLLDKASTEMIDRSMANKLFREINELDYFKSAIPLLLE